MKKQIIFDTDTKKVKGLTGIKGAKYKNNNLALYVNQSFTYYFTVDGRDLLYNGMWTFTQSYKHNPEFTIKYEEGLATIELFIDGEWSL